MKSAVLTRTGCSPEGTVGTLTFGDKTVRTLELPWNNNKPQHSCIPLGTYITKWQISPHHGPCYHLQDVPDRDHILIHPANFAGDETLGFTSELLGCIAPVTGFSKLMNKTGNMQMAGVLSKMALHIFEGWAQQEDLELTIKE